MRSKFAVVTALVASLFITACGTGGTLVNPNPSADQQEAVRIAAARIGDGVNTGVSIVRAAGRFIDTLDLPDSEKNEFDQAIVSVMGTTAQPGPLVAGYDALQSATSEASLLASVNTILTVVDPLIIKLEGHTNLAIAGFGVSLRAALTFARNYVTQASGGVARVLPSMTENMEVAYA